MRKQFSGNIGFGFFSAMSKTLFGALALLVVMSCVAAAKNAPVEIQPAVGIKGLLMVPMRDGVKLATDIEIPAGTKGPLPTILFRTPYGRTMGGVTALFRGFIGNNYAFVFQDTRGRFDSEGDNAPFLTDREDGYDTVEWVAKQPWSDSRVTILGGSALAIAGYQAAIESPPHLKCVLSAVAPANLQSQAILWGGELRKDLAIGWTVGSNYPLEALEPMMKHPLYDDFVKRYDLTFNAGRVKTPMYHIGGWFDIFTQGSIAAYKSLQEKGGPGARGNQRLVMGPWTHGGEISVKQGQLRFPDNSSIMPLVGKIMGWMNNCMDDKLKPDPYPVQYYMMGDVDSANSRWNVWMKSATWPPTGSKEKKWFMTPAGKLDSSGAPKKTKAFSYRFDPANPVKTLGGGNLSLISPGPEDQREVENRPDVLLFETPKFSAPYAIAGSIHADLTVTTTGCDTDFTAKLTDVYPDGRSMLIADGIARTSFREVAKGRLLSAKKNQKMKIRVYVGDTAYTFNKGHIMRLAVSSSNHPRFSVSTGTCEATAFPHKLLEAEYMAEKNKDKRSVHDGVHYVTVQNTVFTGGADASTLVIETLEK